MSDWFEQPANHILVIYLPNDLETSNALFLFEKVCRDHKIVILETDAEQGYLKAGYNYAEFDVELLARSGRHPVNGNMLLIEYNRFIGQKVAFAVAGVLLVAVAVAAVVLVAMAAKDVKLNRHTSTGSHILGGVARGIAQGVAEGISHSAMYAAIDARRSSLPPRVSLETVIASEIPCQSPKAFENRGEFFEYFFENTKRFFFNCGYIRLPNRDPLSSTAKSLKGIVRQHKIGGYATRLFVYYVTAADIEISQLLRVDVISSGPVVVYARHNKKPVYKSQNSIQGKRIGSHTYHLMIGTSAENALKPGPWYIIVASNTLFKPIHVKVAASLHTWETVDTANAALVGRLSISGSRSSLEGPCFAKGASFSSSQSTELSENKDLEDSNSTSSNIDPPSYSFLANQSKQVSNCNQSVEPSSPIDNDWELVVVEEPAAMPIPKCLSRTPKELKSVGKDEILEDSVEQFIDDVLNCTSLNELQQFTFAYEGFVENVNLKEEAQQFLKSFWRQQKSKWETVSSSTASAPPADTAPPPDYLFGDNNESTEEFQPPPYTSVQTAGKD